LEEINCDTGKYTYGYKNTIDALEQGAVEHLIVYDNCNQIHEEEEFIDWIIENYKDYGCKLSLVSDRSGEAN